MIDIKTAYYIVKNKVFNNTDWVFPLKENQNLEIASVDEYSDKYVFVFKDPNHDEGGYIFNGGAAINKEDGELYPIDTIKLFFDKPVKTFDISELETV